jgi:hypothetical protein
VLSLLESLRAHESFWTTTDGIGELHTWGTDLVVMPDIAAWDYQALAAQARHDLKEIKPLLESVLEAADLQRVMDDGSDAALPVEDELWARIVYAFLAEARRGRTGAEHLADMFVPLYMWRAAAFMARTALEPPRAVQSRLDALCETFQRLKPVLVRNWSAGV